MNIEQLLNYVADRYRSLGFKVVRRPGPDDLPPFAKDFKVEVLATGTDGNVLTSAKASPLEVASDPNLPRYGETIEQQPGWRFEVLVLDPAAGLPKQERPAVEPSEDVL